MDTSRRAFFLPDFRARSYKATRRGFPMEFWLDPQKLADFRRGERSTLSQVYQSHVQEVAKMLSFGFSFQSGGELIRFHGMRAPSDLHEVLQDTFVRAFAPSARQAYDASRPFGPYLKQIAKNAVVDGFRKKALDGRYFVTIGRLVHEGESDEEAIGRLAEDREPNPEDLAARAQLAGLVARFVDTLDDEDRRIVADHLVGDLSQAQMAEAMGVDRNEVRRRLKTIRERLLRFLKSEGAIAELDPRLVLELLMVWS